MISIPFFVLAILGGSFILLGLVGIVGITGEVTDLALLPMSGALALTALGSGAAIFEILVVAVLSRVSDGGSGVVALALGIAAAVAACALFLMTLSAMQLLGWLVLTAAGLSLALWFVRKVDNLDEPYAKETGPRIRSDLSD